VTAITEEVKETGRIVEVTLSSLGGRGVAAVEFYTVTGSGNLKKLSKVTGGVYEFEKFGSKILFPTTVSEDFGGWVVLSRSVKSGRIIGAIGSMAHLIDFAKGQVPETLEFTVDDDGLKTLLLAKVKES
jgi:hypothetical protein